MNVRHRVHVGDAQRTAAGLPRPRRSVVDDLPVVEQRWTPHPWLSRLVQGLVLALPVAAAVAVASLASRPLPQAHGVAAAIGWWVAVLAISSLALWATDRLARRLLPLAWLLRLSLVFPDSAPPRFRLAARSWNSRRLRELLDENAGLGALVPGTAAEAAARIVALLASLAVHDRRTRGHCERVAAYNDLIAAELGLSQADRDRLRWVALIHDIGKLSVAPELLNKPGKPTDDEWTELRAHPSRGAAIAKPLATWLGEWLPTIEQHHERWDGSGYPHGLAGPEISLGARIVAVADAFEVMTSPRPYSRAVDPDTARAELVRCAGEQFDPMVVRAFLSVSLGKLRRAMGLVAWAATVPFLSRTPRLESAIVHSGNSAVSGASAAATATGLVVAVALGPMHVGAPVHHRTEARPLPRTASSAPRKAVALPPVVPVVASTATKPHSIGRDHVAAARHPRRHHHHAVARSAATAPRAATKHVSPAHHRVHATHHSSQHHRSVAHHSGLTAAAWLRWWLHMLREHEHGRCSGNSGGGLGNGGPRSGDHRHESHHEGRPGARRAHGLHACD
ncbi:MAG: HD-GYP domain-containing protein [Frankiales bacterium]|nr:HD-GYP domain-containing protein [Frankiales bacterium]